MTTMEKFSESKSSKSGYGNNSSTSTNLWDCGSTLYDSFELNSFKRELDSAILNSHRTLSMSRLPERRLLRLPLQPLPEKQTKKPFNISRSVQKFLRSVFRSSNNNNNKSTSNSFHQVLHENYSKERFYVLYDDKSGSVLSTIPEGPEFEISAISPEISSLVRRSASERFSGTAAIGISCA